MIELKIDEEFRQLLIPLTEDEKEKLELDIVANGCLDTIKVWDGMIVDGHHRYAICREYGIDFRTQKMDFADRDEALVWALENQLARRNLNNFQRAETALKIKDIVARKAKAQQGTRTDLSQKSVESPIDTQKTLAKSASVSHDTIHKVETILARATPIVKERARTGEISVNRAYMDTVAPEAPRLPRREKPLQFEDVIKRTSKLIEEAANAIEAMLEHAELFHDGRYAGTFERWEFDLMIEQILAMIEKLNVARGRNDNENGTSRPKQIESPKQDG